MKKVKQILVITCICLLILSGINTHNTAHASGEIVKVVQVESGSQFTLALMSDGSVYSWGLNTTGQLGIGSTSPWRRNYPVKISGLSSIIAISAGTAHALALRADGAVMSWGMNNRGQLGNGTKNESYTPIQVSGLSGVTAISAGAYHSLALLSNGTVRAWGSNDNGRLGDGTTTDKLTSVQVSGLSGVTAISAGGSHSLALISNGTVKAFGLNTNGQLGDGTTNQRTTPVQVANLTGVTAISAGNLHSLALLSDGTIRGWGSNGSGRIGDGTTVQKNTPVQVSGITDAIAISAGSDHSLAVRANNTIMGWGYNSYGQVGDGTEINRATPVPASTANQPYGIAQVSAGNRHSMALVGSSGVVFGWGDGYNGAIGNGHSGNDGDPWPIHNRPYRILSSYPEVTATGTSSVSMSWTKIDYGYTYNQTYAGLELYRNGVYLKTINKDGGTTTDTGLTPNTLYTYAVGVKYGPFNEGNAIDLRPSMSRYTLAAVPGISFGTSDSNSIPITIQANENPSHTRYFVQRATNSSFTFGVTTIRNWQTGTSFTDTGLSPGTTYYYRVKARNGENVETAYSSTTNAITSPIAPSGTAEGLDWHQAEGRGFVVINWSPIIGATGYEVGVFDGGEYRWFDAGDTTSWDSRAAKIYPAEVTINGYASDTRSVDIFNRSLNGLQLRDNPNNLYRSSTGTSYNSNTNYSFKLRAYNTSGTSGESTEYTITLPNRTDNIKPIASTVRIGDGEAKTYTRNVELFIEANDALSGVVSVQVSNDGFSSFETFPFSNGSGTIQWQLTPGEGTKTVSVRVVDMAGNTSDVRSASIAMESDKVAPQVFLSISNGAESTDSQEVTLFINAYDNITPVDQLQMRVSDDGITWMRYESDAWVAGGWSPYVSHPGIWTLPDGGGMKYVYVQVKDADGNIGIAAKTIFYMDGSNRPTGETTITATTTAGSGVNLNGHIIEVDGKLMQVIQGNTASLQLTGLQEATSITVSHDGVTWSPPEQIPVGADNFTKLLTFSAEGKRAVHIKLRNQFGAESEPIVLHFLVDHTSPSVTARTRNNITATRSTSVEVQITATDNLSNMLFYSLNGGSFAALPANGVVTAPVTANGLNEINITVIDESGNSAPTVVQVWKLE